MSTIDHARERVAAALEEIDRLMQSEFPSQHPKDAMNILRSRFQESALALDRIESTIPLNIVHTECNASLERLFVSLPILGFILRSTNVRNGFEAYGLLLRLAKHLMGSNAKLIVSSEWEFSPFVYRCITDLPDFVLIGLPATESSNPLVIPLAGHELGHSVWYAETFSVDFNSRMRQSVLSEITDNKWKEYSVLFPKYKKIDLDEDFFGQLTWQPALNWSLLQAEEMFCDFLGVRLFAESYLHAFAYLIAPGTSGQRSVGYPNIKRRVLHLIDAAKHLDVNVPADFAASFTPETEPTDPTTAFLVSIADTVTESCASDLLEKVTQFANSTNAPMRDHSKVSGIVDQFKKWVVPTPESETLPDITCAGWECNLDKNLWGHTHQIGRKDWGRVLRDVMFKSMEVSEIHERLEEAARSRGSS